MFSKWYKADLHIHTDMSRETKENDYKGIYKSEILIEKLKENSVDIISLTDHNIINLKAYEDIGKSGISYLIGVELDVSISSEDLINYVKQIHDSSTKVDIKPFHALVLFRSRDYLSISDKLEKMYVDISKELLPNIADLSVHKKLRVTTMEYIVKHFHDEDFFIIAHGNKDKGIVDPYKKENKIEDAQLEILIGGINALEMKSNANMMNVINHYNEGFQKLLREDFQGEKTTAYVSFSDNHNCQEYELRKMQTWIKGQPTFETLRLAFSDPNSRIYTSETPPVENTNYIEKMKLTQSNGLSQDIEFSPYLNVIIGGRSSGKSLLFNSLVNMNNLFSQDDKEVFRKNYQTYVDSEKTFLKLRIGEFEKNVSIPGETYSQEAIIKLFENDDDLKRKLRSEFIDIDDEEVKLLEMKFDKSIDAFLTSYSKYYEISSRINKGDIKEYFEIAQKEVESIFNIDIDNIPAKEDIVEYDNFIKLVKKVKEELNIMNNYSIYNQQVFNDNEKRNINEFIKLLDNKIEILETEMQKNQFKIIFKNKISDIRNSYISQELPAEKKMIEEVKDKLASNIEEYKKYFCAKLKMKKACDELEALDIKIDDKINMTDKYKFITKINLNISGDKIINEFFCEKIMNYNAYNSLYNNMLLLANNFYQDVRIKQIPLDGKKPEKLTERLKDYTKTIKSKKSYEIIECLEDGQENSSLSTSQGKKASIFLDIKLKNMLKNYNNSILLIDQVEDNIDNKYISQELVKVIRKLKKKMQIILVTHNPSIAIYGDAENIIIADNKQNSITYKQGGLEDVDIREEACRILDGGEAAFKNRMDKYNINILNMEE